MYVNARIGTPMNAKEAFRLQYSKDAALVELSENNHDFVMESIGARHRWTAFKSGWFARQDEFNELNEELASALYEIKNQEAELKDWVRSLAHEAELEVEVEKLKEQLWVSQLSSALLQDTTPAS